MNKVFDILPSLSAEQKEKKANGGKAIDNFTVKKCPLMDNFESMDPTTMWKPLIGSQVKLNQKPNVVNAKIIAQSCNRNGNNDSLFVLTTDFSNNVVDSSNNVVDSSNNVAKPTYMDMLPNIQGITPEKEAYIDDDNNDDDGENVKLNEFKLHTTTKLYVGALSLVGLFVLYRVVKKTI